MVIGMHGSDNTGVRFGHGRRVVARAIVDQQTAHFHYLLWNNHIGGISSKVRIRVTWCPQDPHRSVRVINSRLNGKLIPRLKLLAPLCSHLNDFTCKLMSDNHRILCCIIGDPFVIRSLDGCFIG